MKYSDWLKTIEFDLNYRENTVAAALWERGTMTAREISKVIGFPAYRTLATLMNTGLISWYGENRRRIYSLNVTVPRGECEDILEYEEKKKKTMAIDQILNTLPVREARKLYDALGQIFNGDHDFP